MWSGPRIDTTNQIFVRVVQRGDAPTLQGFIVNHVDAFATVCTDECKAYSSLPYRHEAVWHSTREYVRAQAHTNGIESFWSLLESRCIGTYHWMSPKHLYRYVREFSGRHNLRDLDTLDQMAALVTRMVGKRLR